jgi:hypothetical protein
MLTVLLGGVLTLFLGLVLVVISGGLLFQVVGVGAGIFLLGLAHYALWGRAMSESVAGKREEEELLRRVQEREEGRYHR